MAESGHRLLILIARNEDAFDPLITGFLDVGITGATILESRGIGAVIREDMPIFSGALPHSSPSTREAACSSPSRPRIGSRASCDTWISSRPEQPVRVGAVIPVEAVIGFGH